MGPADGVEGKWFSLNNDNTHDINEKIVVMLNQEASVYRCSDYLNDPVHEAIDETWRRRMCEWMYGVVDHCRFRRDTVATAMSYLDRCLSVPNNGIINSRRTYQLTAMTCLQLAIKLFHKPYGVHIHSFVKLGRGLFTAEDLIEAESNVLFMLRWYVHPPTATTFLDYYLLLCPESLLPSTRYILRELSKFMIELAVCVYEFALEKPSIVAYSALMIAVEQMDEDALPLWHSGVFFDRVKALSQVTPTTIDVQRVKNSLRKLLDQHTDIEVLIGSIDPHHRPPKKTKRRRAANSPMSTMKKSFPIPNLIL